VIIFERLLGIVIYYYYLYIMSEAKESPIKRFGDNDNEIYYVNPYGMWSKKVYDVNGNKTYYETSNGYWYKREYDANGNRTYHEDSYGTVTGTKRVDPIQEDDEITLKEIKDLIVGMNKRFDLIEKRLG
jgi:hypothetical protein